MKKYILPILISILLSAGIIVIERKYNTTPFEHTRVIAMNACLVDSVTLSSVINAHQSLFNARVWSKVVAFTITTKEGKIYGHALCFFEYKGKFFIYEPAQGSFTVTDLDLRVTPALKILTTIIPGIEKIEINLEL